MKTRQNYSVPKNNFVSVFFIKITRKYLSLFAAKNRNDKLAHDPTALLSLLLGGTMLFILLLISLLLMSCFMLSNTHIFSRIFIGLVFLAYVLLATWTLKNGRTRTAGIMLLVLYVAISSLSVVLWSITAPFGLLLFGFTVVLSGSILGSIYTLPTALVVVLIMSLVQLAAEKSLIIQDRTAVVLQPNLLDVGGFGTIFFILALVSWISGRQMEYALKRALSAESELKIEKSQLAVRLEKRTRKLQTAQLKEMQQLYRFAELGQLSTALLHDLANHLTVLSIDIEDIHRKQHSEAIASAKTSIYYLDQLVDQVRVQLQGETSSRQINVLFKIHETASHLSDKAKKSNVKIEIQPITKKNPYICFGDPIRLRQVLTILISNAIDAYGDARGDGLRSVEVKAELRRKEVIVRITDWGVGISHSNKSKIFKPFHTTKANGMGIGLFIAKEIIQSHFRGDLTLEATKGRTTFAISIPQFKSRVLKSKV